MALFRSEIAHLFPSSDPSGPESAAPSSLYSRTKSMFNLDSFRSPSAASFGSLVEESEEEEEEDEDELERLRRRRRQSEHFSSLGVDHWEPPVFRRSRSPSPKKVEFKSVEVRLEDRFPHLKKKSSRF